MSVTSFDEADSPGFGGIGGDHHHRLDLDDREDSLGLGLDTPGGSVTASPSLGQADVVAPTVAFRGETRGRHKQDNLPPSRAREVQRAFRARRAAHLARLEDRIDFLERENNEFRTQLGLPLQQNTRDLGSGPTGRGKSLAEGGIPMAERVKAKKERERLRREQEALAKGLKVPLGPPIEETNPAYLPGPSAGAKRKVVEGANGIGSGETGGPGPSTAKKQKQGKKAAAKAEPSGGKSTKKGKELERVQVDGRNPESYTLEDYSGDDFGGGAHESSVSVSANGAGSPHTSDPTARRSLRGGHTIGGAPDLEEGAGQDEFMGSFLANAAAGPSRQGNHDPISGLGDFSDASAYHDMLEAYGLQAQPTGQNQTHQGQTNTGNEANREHEHGFYNPYIPSGDMMSPASANAPKEPLRPPYQPSPWAYSHASSASPAQEVPSSSLPDLFSIAARLPEYQRQLLKHQIPANPFTGFAIPGSAIARVATPGQEAHVNAWPTVAGAPNPFANMPPAQFQAMLAQAAHLVTPDFSAQASVASGSTPRTAQAPSPYVLTPSSSTGHHRQASPPLVPDEDVQPKRKAAKKAVTVNEEVPKWPTPPTTPTGPDLLTRLRQCCHLSDTHVTNDPGVLLFASRLCLAVSCGHGGKHHEIESAKAVDPRYMVIEDAWRMLREHLDPPQPEETATTLSGFAAGMAKPRGDGQNQIATGRLAAEMVLRAARAKVGSGTASTAYWVECADLQGLVIRRELVLGLVGVFSGDTGPAPESVEMESLDGQDELPEGEAVDDGQSEGMGGGIERGEIESDSFLRNQTGLGGPRDGRS